MEEALDIIGNLLQAIDDEIGSCDICDPDARDYECYMCEVIASAEAFLEKSGRVI